jgi:Recombination directionality factor-like
MSIALAARPIDMQAKGLELGRIRIGEQIPIGNGKARPGCRETWRLTSRHKSYLEELRTFYGGTIRPWTGDKAPAGEWELLTDVSEMQVLVSLEHSLSQNFEQWVGGGCKVRCDGEEMSKPVKGVPCQCDPEARLCKMHSRVSVILQHMPSGLWRLDSTSKIFGSEIWVDTETWCGMGVKVLPCRLLINRVTIKKPGEGAKTFGLPGLSLDIHPQDVGKRLAGMTLEGQIAAAREILALPDDGGIKQIEAPKTLTLNDAVKAERVRVFGDGPTANQEFQSWRNKEFGTSLEGCPVKEKARAVFEALEMLGDYEAPREGVIEADVKDDPGDPFTRDTALRTITTALSLLDPEAREARIAGYCQSARVKEWEAASEADLVLWAAEITRGAEGQGVLV